MYIYVNMYMDSYIKNAKVYISMCMRTCANAQRADTCIQITETCMTCTHMRPNLHHACTVCRHKCTQKTCRHTCMSVHP